LNLSEDKRQEFADILKEIAGQPNLTPGQLMDEGTNRFRNPRTTRARTKRTGGKSSAMIQNPIKLLLAIAGAGYSSAPQPRADDPSGVASAPSLRLI